MYSIELNSIYFKGSVLKSSNSNFITVIIIQKDVKKIKKSSFIFLIKIVKKL